MFKEKITLAITGASGSLYALKLMESLVKLDCQVFLLMSAAARVVIKTEAELDWPEDCEALSLKLTQEFSAKEGQIKVFSGLDWFSPVASGSSAPKKMVICPCSCGTLASITHGLSDNLIERAADVVLKEKGQLLVVPRETPFSTLHLENMLALAKLGVTIMPAAPGFYHQPKTIDDLVEFIVARILDHLGLEHKLGQRWAE